MNPKADIGVAVHIISGVSVPSLSTMTTFKLSSLRDSGSRRYQILIYNISGRTRYKGIGFDTSRQSGPDLEYMLS
jgi:hypothetical protein